VLVQEVEGEDVEGHAAGHHSGQSGIPPVRACKQ
jgi:hypothetical protein